MRVIRDLRELGDSPRPAAVTLGNFDGVHVGHQKLLRRAVELARALGATATALTFDPHPTQVLAPERAAKLLTPLPQKVRLIEEHGVELLVVLPFTAELAALSPAEFAGSILVGKLRTAALVVGPNFRFGHRRAGDVEVLRNLARQEGFRLEMVPEIEARGERVSSSRIRELLQAGRVSLAGRLLGRPFAIGGPVVAGLGIGKKQTVPTLNLAPVEAQLPKIGVYVTRTRLGGIVHDSVTNVGHKPTFGEHRLTVESFLLNFSGEVREPEMEVGFLCRLRDEIKFPDPAALKSQIQKDASRALKFFRLMKLGQEGKAPRLAL
jgi:riboflavin kinase/FMN adenylyltransferase